jgi:hypothetical protein
MSAPSPATNVATTVPCEETSKRSDGTDVTTQFCVLLSATQAAASMMITFFCMCAMQNMIGRQRGLLKSEKRCVWLSVFLHHSVDSAAVWAFANSEIEPHSLSLHRHMCACSDFSF